MDPECQGILAEILLSHDLEKIEITGATNASPLMPSIAKLKKLREFGISLGEMTETEMGDLPVAELTHTGLKKTHFTPQLTDVLSGILTKMKKLESLSFLACTIDKPCSFGRVLCSASCINLTKFGLADVQLGDADLGCLCQSFVRWKRLKSVRVSRIELLCDSPDVSFKVLPSNFSLRSLFLHFQNAVWSWIKPQEPLVSVDLTGQSLRLKHLLLALSHCTELEELNLNQMGLDEAVVSFICDVIDSNKCIERLSLFDNKLSSSALRKISDSLQNRRLVELYIDGNEGSADLEVVRDLQQRCNLVQY
jgi:hypothetical protein